MKYILDDTGHPVAEPDTIKWSKWFETAKRHVAKTRVADSTISTVFLGLDHAFDGGAPVLWETMVFGGKLDQEQDRCSGLREQAEAMHARMVERVNDGQQLEGERNEVDAVPCATCNGTGEVRHPRYGLPSCPCDVIPCPDCR